MDDVDSSGAVYQSSIGIKEDTQSSDALLPSPEVNNFRDDLNKQLKHTPQPHQSPPKAFRKEAEHLLLEEFPSKIAHFKAALDGQLFSLHNMSNLKSDFDIPASLCNGLTNEDQSGTKPVTKKRKMEGSEGAAAEDVAQQHLARLSTPMPCNKKLVEVTSFLKPEIVECIDKCNLIKLWVELLIPKIEDGNNFGVGVQEDILAEVSKAESDAGTYLEQVSRYYTARAKLVSKVLKYPFLEDYRRAVEEFDEKAFCGFRLICREVRNIYIVLYDMILKNYEKVRKPRSENTGSLY